MDRQLDTKMERKQIDIRTARSIDMKTKGQTDGWMDGMVGLQKDGQTDGFVERRATESAAIIFRNNLILLFPLQPVTNINLLYRLVQLRESGVQFRIRQHFLPSTQSITEPSSIVVRLETIAPILMLLAAGNVIGFLIIMIEQFVHGIKVKTCSTIHIR